MKITKKELFKFCDDNNDAINELQSQSDNTDFLLAVLMQQLKDSGVIDEISPEPKPQPKQLDQSVFNGLDEKWRFAAVDGNKGFPIVYEFEPYAFESGKYYSNHHGLYKDLTHLTGYDASNWQNSLIERDIAKELLEVDLSSELTGSELCKAMLARGDTRIMCIVSDEGTRQDLTHVIRAYSDGKFHTKANRWSYAVPINNQGEPLTASEVGL